MKLRYLLMLILLPAMTHAYGSKAQTTTAPIGVETGKAPIDVETRKVKQLELERQATTEGTEARLIGTERLDNPYPLGSVLFNAWEGGWRRADQKQHKKTVPE